MIESNCDKRRFLVINKLLDFFSNLRFYPTFSNGEATNSAVFLTNL